MRTVPPTASPDGSDMHNTMSSPHEATPAQHTVTPQPAASQSDLWRWAHWHRLGSPRFVCAPMVWQSERAFRMAARQHSGVGLAYTPMVHADMLLQSIADKGSVCRGAYSHVDSLCYDVYTHTQAHPLTHSLSYNGMLVLSERQVE